MSPSIPRTFSRVLAKFGNKGDSADAGKGSLDDYDYDLRPKKGGTSIRLAESAPAQEALAEIAGSGTDQTWAMIARRGVEEERTDAPMPVRLFANGRVSGVVGIVPRGLEAPVDAAIVRLIDAGKPPRIPATIASTRDGFRVDVAVGATR
ncbi:hypothetical protein [Marisediminicola senii]|uniref:hypothetical protein n=1 Tax=Marisediminicola senii TaxID=2711233 RepID=UPI0013EDC168|nr:hypothetical protein [Marisediminicola senii]